MEVRLNRFGNVGKYVPILLATGFDHAQHRFHESAAGSALRAERQLSPNHRVPQRSLAGIVCRLDIIVLQKRLQVVHAIQNVLAHAGVFAAQPKRSFFESCVHRSPQFSDISPHCLSRDRAVTVAVPIMKQPLRVLLQAPADGFRFFANVDQTPKVAQQVRSAELLFANPIVPAVAVAGDDPRKVLP